MVEFHVSADKSSTKSESEGLPLTKLPVATVSTSAPTVTADRRAATLPANKCVICIFYISQYTYIHPFIQCVTFYVTFLHFFYQINLPVAICMI